MVVSANFSILFKFEYNCLEPHKNKYNPLINIPLSYHGEWLLENHEKHFFLIILDWKCLHRDSCTANLRR